MTDLEIVIGISGASGAGYGIRLLEALEGHETHLIITDAAKKIIEIETDWKVEEVEALADHVYDSGDFTAPIASGSYLFDALVVVPCSMGSLAGIAHGTAENLLTRCADVCLKERRTLILVPRETPLSLIHLRNMVQASEAGAVIMPASPGFYSCPKSIDDLVNVMVGRVLDLLCIDNSLYRRWGPGGNAYNSSDQSTGQR